MQLAKGSGIHGRVVDAQTGAPVAGAKVGPGIFLYEPNKDYVRTDRNGEFEIIPFEARARMLRALPISNPTAVR